MKASVRVRIAGIYAMLSVFFLMLALTGIALTVNSQLTSRLQNSLESERKWLESEIFKIDRRDNAASPPQRNSFFAEEIEKRYQFTDFFVLVQLDSMTYRGGFLKKDDSISSFFLLNLHEGFYEKNLNGAAFKILITRAGSSRTVIGVKHPSPEIYLTLVKTLFWILPLAALFVLGIGLFFARLAVRPVVQAVEAAEKITLEKLDNRLPVYHGNDEFSALVNTLNKMISRIEDGVHSIQQFTQDAAHELKTPLTVLRGELEFASQEKNLDDELKYRLQRSLDRVISLNALVENLLFLARTDSNQVDLKYETFNLSDTVKDLVEDCQILAKRKSINVESDPGSEISLEGDMRLVYSLLMNLMENAIKYTAEKGRVGISLRDDDRRIEISIRDTGKGISKEHIAKIFDRFYRTDSARTSGGGGVGLGLAICKQIVTLHKGTISVNSIINKGTDIRINLPKSR